MILPSTSVVIALAANALLAAPPAKTSADPVHLLEAGTVPASQAPAGSKTPSLEMRTTEGAKDPDAFLLVAGKPVARRITIDVDPTSAPEKSGPFKSHLARLVRTLGEPTRQSQDTLPYQGGNILIVRTAKTRTWDLPGGKVVLAAHRTEFDIAKAKEIARDMIKQLLKERPDTPKSRSKELESMAIENLKQDFIPEATVQLRAWDTLPVEAFARSLELVQRNWDYSFPFDPAWGFDAEVPSQRIVFRSREAPESWFSLAGGTRSVARDTVRALGDTATAPMEHRVRKFSERIAFESRVALPFPGLRKYADDQISLMIRDGAEKAGRNGASESDIMLIALYASLMPRVVGPTLADHFESRTLIVTHDRDGE